MGEYIREMSVKVKVYIDTNKRTVEEEFDNMKDAQEFLDDFMEDL